MLTKSSTTGPRSQSVSWSRDDNGVVCKIDYMSVLVEALTLICIKIQSGERTHSWGEPVEDKSTSDKILLTLTF